MFSNDEAGIGNEDAWLMKKKKKVGGWRRGVRTSLNRKISAEVFLYTTHDEHKTGLSAMEQTQSNTTVSVLDKVIKCHSPRKITAAARSLGCFITRRIF